MTVFHTLPIDEITHDYQAGDSLRTLARRHAVSYGTIRRILAVAAVPVRGPGHYNPMIPATTILKVDYTPRAVWTKPVPGTLHPLEVDRLRRAIGWDVSWTRPYDPAHGDVC